MPDISILLLALYGSLLGVMVGMIPGLGSAQLLGIMFGALMLLPPVEVLVFYIGLLTVSQYVDSVPSIYFGVPGETSAIPAAFEGPMLRDQGLAETALRLTAIGRIMATVVSVCLAAMIVPVIISTTWFFSNQAQVLLLIAAVIGVAWSSSSSKIWTAISMVLGYGLGTIGFHPATGQNWLTFGNINLESGVPLVTVLLGIYVVPLLIHAARNCVKTDYVMSQSVSMPSEWWRYRWCMFRSSVAGWFVGLIPGLSYILASTVCYNWERIRQKRQNQYQPGNMSTVVASETGNTAGAISTVIPLVLFGIPITGSETILYDIMLLNGADFAQGRFLSEYWGSMLTALVTASMIGLLLCWPLGRLLARVFAIVDLKILWITLLALIVAIVAYVGWYNNQMIFYITAFVSMCIIGMLLSKKVDPVSAMFMFVMQDSIDQAIFNAIQFAQ